jgi:2-polyprenyl-6-methoxyphenol hydroxylase-like FAD-dependent oxidoreductase
MTDITVTQEDLQKILQQKIQQISNMELQIAALIRTITEQDEKIESLRIEADKEELNGSS